MRILVKGKLQKLKSTFSPGICRDVDKGSANTNL